MIPVKIKKVEKGKESGQRCSGHERLDTSVVANPLHDITYVLRIKKADRQPHQLGDKVRNQSNAYPGIHVQTDPTLDKTDSCLCNRQHKLRYQYQCDEIQVIVSDTLIDHSLCQKRKNKGKYTTQ